jgi:hypothetical protein
MVDAIVDAAGSRVTQMSKRSSIDSGVGVDVVAAPHRRRNQHLSVVPAVADVPAAEWCFG